MLPRDRVLATFHFEPTVRPALDLMEGVAWTELKDWFQSVHGFRRRDDVLNFLGTDFRWIGLKSSAPPELFAKRPEDALSNSVAHGPLSGATTVAEIEAHPHFDPAWWQPDDYAAFHARWPDHARVFNPGWRPLFWTACEAFGMEQALMHMVAEPELFDAFVRRHHDFFMDVLRRGLGAARGHCDLCLLGDDVAGQQAMLMSPALWRERIKPYLAEEVRLAREHGMMVLFHSCGAVRPILNDLIEIGVNALLVFQTTAAGMDAPSIAAEFGGRMVFYGGIDVQKLMSFGTPEQVRAEVRANIEAFRRCGGYVVANSHHGLDTIKGENIVAMCQAARE